VIATAHLRAIALSLLLHLCRCSVQMFTDPEFHDPGYQSEWDRFVQGKLHGILGAFVTRQLLLELFNSSWRRIDPDMFNQAPN